MPSSTSLRLRCLLDDEHPSAPSLAEVWLNADWDERETWEMFGIEFSPKTTMRHLLLPSDWVGYPLRRDYPVGGEAVDFSEDRKLWMSPPPGA